MKVRMAVMGVLLVTLTGCMGAPQGQSSDPLVKYEELVRTGNRHYDNNQPLNAVLAYEQALAIKPDDPNVLSDLGAMYRSLGRFKMAERTFLKALESDPGHVQALFNIGVVYKNDLNDPATARKYWSKYLEVRPNGPGADRIRSELEQMN